MLSHKTIQLLFDRLRFNLTLEEIILNTRRLPNFMIRDNHTLAFVLKSIVIKKSFETEVVRNKILTQSYRELIMNKSTLWYQRKRLGETGSICIYNNTRQYFA